MKERQHPTGRIHGAVTALCFVALMSGNPAFAAEGVADGDNPPPGVLDNAHSTASDQVRRFGAWVDSFFTDENYVAEVNKTFLRLRLDNFSELYEGSSIKGKARLHLKLPALNDRLRIEILSPGESEDAERAGAPDTASPPPGTTDDRTTAGISYILRALEERSVILRAGLGFDGYSPDPFVGARYRETIPLNDDWSLRFIQRLRYYSLSGLDSRTTIDADRVLEDNTLFRASVNGTWLEEQPDYFYNVSFALYRPIDDQSAVQYEIVNEFKTDPHRLDRITARIAHRQRIYRDWLVFEVAPQVSFPDARDFKPVLGILFRLEAVFGG
jgi:hypothetical protein